MKRWLLIALTIAGLSSARAKVSPEDLAKLPPAAAKPVDFIRDIQPIIEKKCLQCHGRGHDKGGFRLDDRALLLGESDSGKSIVTGNSRDSYLIHLVAGLEPDNIMPQKGGKLSAEQVGLLRAWIDQGAPWPKGISFAKQPSRNLNPTEAALPKAKAGENPVDTLLAPYFKTNKVRIGVGVDDRIFARRAYLDLIGLLPEPAELEAFLADRSRDKRGKLVRKLLADDQRYAEHWLTFWNDLLRNDYRGTGYIDGGRKQITQWLFSSLKTNKSYDRFVAELVHPKPETEGFSKGIVWRGVVNASQLPPIQAAQNISQVFMGVNLKCASCHDSFIDDWKLSDAYSLAGVYSDGPLELVECDKPLGKKVKVAFLYPELGALNASTNKAERTARLAEVMTSRENGRLSRTMVNRLWQRFFGHGLVANMDDMEQPAWHPELLNWLAEDLVDHGYDLRHTMARIVTSRAYQLGAAPEAAPMEKGYVFRGPSVRRMNAEQLVDAISQLTGLWRDKPTGDFKFTTNQLAELKGRTRAALVAADPLMVALDRPNREQVVTVRQSTPTTLQALELTNGGTLNDTLKRGAAKLASSTDTKTLVQQTYLKAFSRKPGAAERRMASALVGAKQPTAGGTEDFLWAIVMQPEFQLIY